MMQSSDVENTLFWTCLWYWKKAMPPVKGCQSVSKFLLLTRF